MPEGRDVDVARIMEKIRESARRSRTIGEMGAAQSASPTNGRAAPDLRILEAVGQIQDVPLASHRPVAGRFVVFVKSLLRQLLTPILERQVAYNLANTRVLTNACARLAAIERRQALAAQEMDQRLDALARQTETLVGRLQDLGGRIDTREAAQDERWREAELHRQAEADLHRQTEHREADLRGEADAREARWSEQLAALAAALRRELTGAESRIGDRLGSQADAQRTADQQIHAVLARISGAERKLRRILHVLATGQSDVARLEGTGAHPAAAGPEPPFDHAAFEERFRGSEEWIREGQRRYLPYFDGRDNVVDLGCGRGEFLELLGESGISARGVDLDLDMVLVCRDKGLDVAVGDAFAYLEAAPDDSLGGIFSAQLIEHLPARRVIELVRLCHRKLARGGILIVETPNPKCLMVLAETFYRDPSRVQPHHPDTMRFILETAGFEEIEVAFSAPLDAAIALPLIEIPGVDLSRLNQAIERLNALVFGFQDYAVIGHKFPARRADA